MPSSPIEPDRADIVQRIEQLGPWFHRIELGDGLATKSESFSGEDADHPRATWEKVRVCLPNDLSGKSVLDVGCNAGFYSIEMKRRGAARVLGVDSQRNLIRQAEFVRSVLNLDIEYRRLSVYDLDPITMGQFDLTLALGLIYHCKHLVLALEKLFAITRETLVLETAVYPRAATPRSFAHNVGGMGRTLHPLAYVENTSEAKEAIYNWFLPGVDALSAMLKNVGFDQVEVFPGINDERAILRCRKRAPYPDSRSLSYLSSRLAFLAGPTQANAGEVLHFRIGAENTGYAIWLRGKEAGDEGAVHLAAHVLRDDEEPIALYHAGAFLPHDVAPGESAEIEIAVRAPDTPGNYLLVFDLVSEHLAWFEDLGSETVRHALVVN
jgi:tRNA (mo5U34)-methyltransferase